MKWATYFFESSNRCIQLIVKFGGILHKYIRVVYVAPTGYFFYQTQIKPTMLYTLAFLLRPCIGNAFNHAQCLQLVIETVVFAFKAPWKSLASRVTMSGDDLSSFVFLHQVIFPRHCEELGSSEWIVLVRLEVYLPQSRGRYFCRYCKSWGSCIIDRVVRSLHSSVL